jgi:hypothetical protein
MDRGIMDSLTNIGVAEKVTGQKWDWDSDKYKSYYKAADTMYNFAPKLDGDIITSQTNLAATEKVLSHPYNLMVQLDSEIKSDPICASSGCDQYKHPDSKVADWPMNYPVPSFGMDRGVQDSLVNLGVAEKITGQKWDWDSDKYKGYYKAADTMYNFAPKLDGDIITSQANLAATEAALSHEYALS